MTKLFLDGDANRRLGFRVKKMFWSRFREVDGSLGSP
tara:strand:+ start:887 stop:997 length:111 start_codon:yes stop_codon:yes gene_type:complete